jgi:uncharacterized phage-associated protein
MPAYKPEPALGFDHQKSVQTIAYLIRKAGKPVEKMKLVKLLYLAERLSFEKRGKPMNFDEFYSMKDGPVVASALNGMNHNFDDPAWNALSLADDNRHIDVVGDVSEDHLSRADMAILDAVWERFGKRTAGQLRQWTHDHCGEYVHVDASRLPIEPSQILEQVGNPAPAETARDIRNLQIEMGRLAGLRAA